MKLRILLPTLLLLLLILLLSTNLIGTSYANYQDGLDAYNKGDY